VVILTLISDEFILKVDVTFFFGGGGLIFKGFGSFFYLNSLSKILACGAEIISILDLCLCLFGLLDFFFYFFWVHFIVFGVYILL
jgi:hypothetical protein